jgi:cytochrome c oxidase subunit I
MLSVLWIALCIAFFAAGAVGGAFIAGASDASLHDAYYVVAHSAWVVSIGVLLVVFAAFHLITTRWLASRYRWSLGWGHLALTALGVALLSAPQIGLAVAPPASYVDYERGFAVWQVVSSAGYVALLLSALLFAALCAALFIPPKKGSAA